MAIDKDETIKKTIKAGNSFFRNIKREDGQVWTTEDTAAYEVRNNLNKKIDEGNIPKSADNLRFEFRYTGTSSWESTKKYTIYADVSNSASGYSDTKLEAIITVK